MKIQEISQRFAASGIENAAFEARLLCDALSGVELDSAVERRCQGYPLQYLLGEWGFYREIYEVNEHCLIPRPDTEVLVEQAVRRLPDGARFLDLCTGSGCVAISTLCERTDATAQAVDLFEPTLEVARRNALRNGVAERLELICADVLQKPEMHFARGDYDAILSNPPYIRNEVVKTLQREVGYEPSAALCGGEDGLDFYRAILTLWRPLLKPQGFFLFEIGYDQAEDLRCLGASCGMEAEIFCDYGGNDRVVYMKQ